jgi:hypothetical protein
MPRQACWCPCWYSDDRPVARCQKKVPAPRHNRAGTFQGPRLDPSPRHNLSGPRAHQGTKPLTRRRFGIRPSGAKIRTNGGEGSETSLLMDEWGYLFVWGSKLVSKISICVGPRAEKDPGRREPRPGSSVSRPIAGNGRGQSPSLRHRPGLRRGDILTARQVVGGK